MYLLTFLFPLCMDQFWLEGKQNLLLLVLNFYTTFTVILFVFYLSLVRSLTLLQDLISKYYSGEIS